MLQEVRRFQRKIIIAAARAIKLFKHDLSSSQNIIETQNLYTRIDELEKLSFEKTNEVLDKILPEAFAVVKETSRRFYNSTQIEVATTEYDRLLSQNKNDVNIPIPAA